MKKSNQLFKKAMKTEDIHQYHLACNWTLDQLLLAKWRHLHLDVTVAHSDLDKANLLNSFFCFCFNMSHPAIHPLITPALSVCPEDILCSESEEFDLLATLVVSKASGQDGISTRMRKSTASSIAPSLTKLFNLSITSGTIPSLWRKSLVVPIPKSQELSNYRPITLLSIISKMLECQLIMITLTVTMLSQPFSSGDIWSGDRPLLPFPI